MVDSLIRLFEQNIEPSYNSSTTRWDWVGLGIGTISDAISCVVEEERNGKYELTMEYPTTGMRYNDIQINRILVVKPNPDSDPQGFRIYQISKSFERTITVNAEHISYQLSHVPILPLSASNCKAAMDALFNSNNQAEPCNFQYWSSKTSTYFPSTSGKVRTGDYEGRALEFEWSLVSQSSSSSTISWTLKGVGKLASYTNGWVMCGPVNVSIGTIKILDNAHDHPNRIQLRENQIIDQGTKVLAHTSGKFSSTINIDTFLYWDENDAGRGKYTGSAPITLPALSGGDATDFSQLGEFKIEEPISLRSALGGDKVSILNTYGGEFEWDNLTVKLYTARGSDRGVTIRYGKNLTSLEQEETIANTFTGIVPYWKGQEPEDEQTHAPGAMVIVTPTHILRDGVPLGDVPPAQDGGVTVTSDALYCDNADLYPYKRTQTKNLTEYFDWSTSEEVTSQTTQLESFWYKVPMPQDVYDMAKEWLSTNEIGVPEVNLTIEFVPLWQTEEYKNLALQESVRLCDIVHVYFEELGVTTSAKVVKTKYNVLLDRYDSIDLSSLGKLKATLATTIASTPAIIDAAVQETQHFVTAALSDATARIAGAYGGRILYNKDENGNPYEMVIAGDPEIDQITGEETYGNFMRFNKEGIGFSTTGFNGPFNSAWTIDGTFDAQVINVINLNADSMNAGTLKSTNWDSSGGTAGFSLNLQNGTIQAPSLVISATSAAKDYTDTTVAGIQIGSTNLLRETRNMPRSGSDKAIRFYTGTASSSFSWTFTDPVENGFVEAAINITGVSTQVWPWLSSSWVPRAKFESSKKLIFSFEIKVDNLTNWAESNVLARIVCKDANHTTWGGDGWRYTSVYLNKSKVPKAGTWYRVSFISPELWQDTGWYTDGTGTWAGVTDICCVLFASRNGSIHIRKFKLEEGDHDTDWSPAPEDADKALADYKQYVTENYATLQVTSDAISAAVGSNKTYTDDSIKALRVGGRNILKNSETKAVTVYGNATATQQDEVSVTEWGCTDAKRVYGSGSESTIFATLGGIYAPSAISIDGQDYRFSIFVKNRSSSQSLRVSYNSLGGSDTLSPGEVKRVISQYTVGNGTNSPTFIFSTLTAGASFDMVYWHPQIEYGTTATDWSPAPEDDQSGGTNILRDTTKDADKSHATYNVADFSFSEALKSGNLYTIHAKVVTSSDKQSVAFYHSGGSTKLTSFQPRVSSHIYKATFTATDEMAAKTGGSDGYGYCRVYASNNEGAQGSTPVTGTAHVEWIKIESGIKASDWSPSPLDVDARINSVAQVVENNYTTFTQTAQSIVAAVNSRAETTYVDTITGNLQAIINEHSATLETLSDSIVGTVKATYIDTLDGFKDEVERWFNFNAQDSFVIGLEGSKYDTQITNDAFNIRYDGEAIGSFNTGGLRTTTVEISDSLILPPLKLETYSSGWLIKSS